MHDSFIARNGKDLAEHHTVTVRYEGEPLRSGKRREYVDSMELDLAQWATHEYIDRKTIHHVVTELEKIRREMHHWTAGISGILVRTREELREEAAEALEHIAAERVELSELEDG